jgi:hypothetical protein
MAPYQERVVTEKTELDEKLTNLGTFFDTDLFKNLDSEEQARMAEQWYAMKRYSDILGARIASF